MSLPPPSISRLLMTTCKNFWRVLNQRTPLWAPNGLWRTSKHGKTYETWSFWTTLSQRTYWKLSSCDHLPAPICSSLKHVNRQLPMHKLPWQKKTKQQIQETLELTLSQAARIRSGNHGETCWNHQQRRKQAMGQGSDGCKLSQFTAYCSVLWQCWRGTLELEAFTTWVMLQSRPLHI